MRAIVWHGPERMSVDDVAEPEPAPGEVLLVPEAVGICGSEVEGYLGRQGNRTPPLIMGHEFAGRIVAAGDAVPADWVGRRAAVNPLVPDPAARPGLENLGARRQLLGVHRPGGFAGAVSVPVGQLRPLPDGADARLGALAEPLANGVHAVRIGQAGAEGDASGVAVVVGAGTIGLMVLQEALLAGIGWVAALEPHPARRALADGLGAHATFADAGAVRAAVREVTDGEGADLVFDAVGLAATRHLAVESVRPGGCAVLVGLATDATEFACHAIIRSEITVRGSYAYSAADYDTALGDLLDGRAGLGELESVGPLEDGPAAFAELAAGASARVKVFLAPMSAAADESLAGRVAVVSGASSGIGLATACRLHDMGADVVGLARRDDAIVAGAGAERVAAGRLRALALDVSDPEAVAAAAPALAVDGRLDVLVCAAGTNLPERRLDQLDAERWRTLVDTNLAGCFNLVSACLPALRTARGLVVLVGSVSGAWPDWSGPAYQAAKAGLLGFARAAGLEEQEHGVRFSLVAPGVVDTPLLDRRPSPPSQADRERALQPGDVAHLIAVLAALPARVHVPELTVLPAALQVLGRTVVP